MDNTDFFDYISYDWNNYSWWASVTNVKWERYCGFKIRAALLLVETKEREIARGLAKTQAPESVVVYAPHAAYAAQYAAFTYMYN